MSAEAIHRVPEFQRRKTAYFQSFMLRHLPEAYMFKENGLLVEEKSRKWRNVAKHQLLSAVMTETISELLEMPDKKTKLLTNLSLIHDVDKRRQQEKMSEDQIIADEAGKNRRPLVATSTNFTGFTGWGLSEFILRYVDSSIGENKVGYWYGPRDPESLPEVLILPWRERIKMFKQNKIAEGEKGMSLYGMTTWDKLEEIMATIENSLYKSIIEKNPGLSRRYSDPSQLTELIEEKIHEKIIEQ
jgi:hypothetical protein